MSAYSRQLTLDLYDSGCIKFENITLKSGKQSPIYIDLRELVSCPSIVESICKLLADHLIKDLHYDLICGVPFTAIPFATGLSLFTKVPMLMKRNETKNYGTKKMIEGKYKTGQRSLIVEDIISSGGSILETVIALKEVGLIVKDVLVVLDREQGGCEQLEKLGIRVHSLIKISDLFTNLVEENKVDREKVIEIMNWVRSETVSIQGSIIDSYNELSLIGRRNIKQAVLDYSEREKLAQNKVAKHLFGLMHKKNSNLCVAIDAHKSSTILEIADKVGPNAVMIKLHCDIIEDFSQTFVNELKRKATEHQFLVFEDRKFADIGNTVKDQFTRGLHKISEWADVINCHVISGEGMLTSLKASADLERTGCLIVAQLSSKGNLITNSYTGVAVKFAENHQDFVIGFISQSRVATDPRFIHMVPGVNLEDSNDKYDKTYNTPSRAIKEKGADIIIVGRGITHAKDPAKISKIYQEEGYTAYKEPIC